MKRYGGLYNQLIDIENLYAAFFTAMKGKKHKEVVGDFAMCQERELFRLQAELMHKTYRTGCYHSFYVYDKKERLISAAPFRDRVVHHALCNIIEPLFEKTFIFDSYANRLGKGTHRAVKRCQQFAGSNKFVLKCDIEKYFPSIDHQILKDLIRRKIKDKDILWLADSIIDGSNEQPEVLHYFPGDDLFTPLLRRRGLPIGNQTSQFFANVYLNPMDHFIKETLRCRHYVRYVDDFLLFANDKKTLQQWGKRIKKFLQSLRLRIHPDKFQIFPVSKGILFLGYRVFPHLILLPQDNIHRFRRRMRRLQRDYGNGLIALEKVKLSINGWLGHARQADSYRLRRDLFRSFSFKSAKN